MTGSAVSVDSRGPTIITPRIRSRLVHVHARLLSEGVGRDVRQPIDEPLLAEIVVDDQQPVGRRADPEPPGTIPP